MIAEIEYADMVILTHTMLSDQLDRVQGALREMLDLIESTSPTDPRHGIAIVWAGALAQCEKDLLKQVEQCGSL